MKINVTTIQMNQMSLQEQGRRGKKSRVYFDHEGESVLQGFGDRAARPHKLYRTVLEQVARQLDLPADVTFRWSRKAGCSMCPCSPGFVVEGHWNHDIWVTVSADTPATTDHRLSAFRRAQLGEQAAADEFATGQLSLGLA